jgi:cytochrome bd-type quinol oxidase subunit 2
MVHIKHLCGIGAGSRSDAVSQLSGFSIVCRLALVMGYGLLGVCWLIWRTEGDLRERSRRHARFLGVATLAMIVVVSVWTPMLNSNFRDRWFDWPNIALVSPVPILVAVLAYWFWRALSRKQDFAPLAAALGWFVLSFAGLSISVYPLIIPSPIPDHFTRSDALYQDVVTRQLGCSQITLTSQHSAPSRGLQPRPNVR